MVDGFDHNDVISSMEDEVTAASEGLLTTRSSSDSDISFRLNGDTLEEPALDR